MDVDRGGNRLRRPQNLPKGKGEFRGIGLVEVIWKLLSLILHRRLAVINLHEVLHGFREVRGTGTATL